MFYCKNGGSCVQAKLGFEELLLIYICFDTLDAKLIAFRNTYNMHTTNSSKYFI